MNDYADECQRKWDEQQKEPGFTDEQIKEFLENGYYGNLMDIMDELIAKSEFLKLLLSALRDHDAVATTTCYRAIESEAIQYMELQE